MKCENCTYYWIGEGDVFGFSTCHFKKLFDNDLAPCEEDQDDLEYVCEYEDDYYMQEDNGDEDAT